MAGNCQPSACFLSSAIGNRDGIRAMHLFILNDIPVSFRNFRTIVSNFHFPSPAVSEFFGKSEIVSRRCALSLPKKRPFSSFNELKISTLTSMDLIFNKALYVSVSKRPNLNWFNWVCFSLVFGVRGWINLRRPTVLTRLLTAVVLLKIILQLLRLNVKGFWIVAVTRGPKRAGRTTEASWAGSAATASSAFPRAGLPTTAGAFRPRSSRAFRKH